MTARPTRRPLARRLAAPVLVVLLPVGLAACGGDDPGPSPDPSSPGSTVGTPTGASGDPTSDPTSSVAPATGPRVVTSRFSFRAPEGFEKSPVAGEFLGSARDLLADDTVYFSILEDHRPASLDELRESYLRNAPYEKPPRVLPDLEIDGVTVFHVAGPIDDRSYGEAFGALVDGAGVTIEFQIHSPAPRRREIVDSTMATFRWR